MYCKKPDSYQKQKASRTSTPLFYKKYPINGRMPSTLCALGILLWKSYY